MTTPGIPYYCEDTNHDGRGCSNRARYAIDGKYVCRVHYNMRADVLSIFGERPAPDHIVSDWQVRRRAIKGE